MAIFNGLRFGNVNSLDYGIYITGEAVYNAPERDVEMVEIAGRNGALPVDKGRWKNIEVTYTAGTFGDDQTDFSTKVRNFRNALTSQLGYVRLSDTYNDNEYRLGVFKSVFEVDAVSRKRAGEFQIVFDCKPQRFLMSGEASQDITSGQDLYNSTGYDAQPLIMVEGYGSVNVGDYSFEIENAVMGKVTLDGGRPQMLLGAVRTSARYSISYQGSLSLVNAGDDLTLESVGSQFEFVINKSASLLTGHQIACSGDGSPTATIVQASGTGQNSTQAKIQVNATMSNLAFTASASATETKTATYTYSGTYGGTVSFSATVTIEVTNMPNGELIFKYTVSSTSGNTSLISLGSVRTWLTIGAVIGDSTVQILGHPTYIDCELGEAYKIVDDTFVSLNRFIDLGSDVPALKGGSNVITFDNTVTSLKIAPRWWIL